MNVFVKVMNIMEMKWPAIGKVHISGTMNVILKADSLMLHFQPSAPSTVMMTLLKNLKQPQQHVPKLP